jgi:hypothetical protein
MGPIGKAECHRDVGEDLRRVRRAGAVIGIICDLVYAISYTVATPAQLIQQPNDTAKAPPSSVSAAPES